MKINPPKTQHEKDLAEYYQNRSKYRHIKPFLDQWKVWGSTIVNTLPEAVKVRGKVLGWRLNHKTYATPAAVSLATHGAITGRTLHTLKTASGAAKSAQYSRRATG